MWSLTTLEIQIAHPLVVLVDGVENGDICIMKTLVAGGWLVVGIGHDVLNCGYSSANKG
jgi:hypothetical protein